MANTLSIIGKAFSPRIMNRAIQAFDQATLVVVISCWASALVVMLFTLYTVSLSVTSKRDVVAAVAQDPTLPVPVRKPPEKSEIQPLVDRLQKRFPDILFSLASDRSLTVSASDGSKFRLWLTVLSYIDTVSPQYRWQIKELCAGLKCNNATPMRAMLTAEIITFKVDTPAEK